MPSGEYTKTKEWKEKMSKALKGKIPWNKGKKLGYSPMQGKKHTEESKNKIRQTLKTSGHKPNFKKGNVPWNKGKKWNKEVRDKISKARIGKPSNSPFLFKKGMKAFPHKILKGEKHPNWKGGITSLRNQIYNNIKNRQWRSDCLERDNYQCVFGGKEHGNKLHVDHIIPFSFILKKYLITNLKDALECEELWNINNGRTLCFECHKKTDTYMFKANFYGK